ncbi:hypothetical protein [Pontibacter arcticus]|nr:hypothetical protein [Pontibacter arcticus]
MQKLFRPYFAFLFMGALAVGISSCDSNDEDEPAPVEEETTIPGSINSLRIEFRPKGQPTATPITAAYGDDDQSDNIPGTVKGDINLDPGVVYDVKVMMTDESQSPPVDLSANTKKTQDYHEFFYSPLQGLKVSFLKTDQDKNGLPVGFTAEATTPATPSKGTLRITLKHMKKDGVILKSATSTVNTGSTDFFAIFPVVID